MLHTVGIRIQTEITKIKLFLILQRCHNQVRCQGGKCATGQTKMVESAKQMHRVCGHVQAVLNRTGFLAAEEEPENPDMSDADEAGYNLGVDVDSEQEVAVGVQWSDTNGSYHPSSGCTEYPIPRGEPSSIQLEAIRKRHRVDNVERDESGNARIFENGWLMGRPLRPKCCRNCRVDLRILEAVAEQAGRAVIHSISNSFLHEIHTVACKQCGYVSTWEPHEDAIHMISNSEGGAERRPFISLMQIVYLLCVPFTVHCVFTIYCVRYTIYCVQFVACNLLCAQFNCVLTTFPKCFSCRRMGACLLVLGARVGKGRGFQWGAHARRSLLPKHTICRRGYVQLPFRFEA